MQSVLFICMGNICRSPTAEGVFRQLVEEEGLSARIRIDSAGTHDYHIGKSPDRRSMLAAQRRGIDLSALCARQVEPGDFESFDWIVAMDRDNMRLLEQQCPPEYRHKLSLLLDHAPQVELREVPDPYYGGAEGFEQVLDLVEEGAQGLLAQVQAALRQR